MAKSGLKHIDVGAELTKTEWESEDSHELLHGNSFPDSPVERQLFYRDDEHKWYIYNASAWVWLGGGGGMAIHGNEYHDPDFADASHTHSDLSPAHKDVATGVHGVGGSTVESVSGSQSKVDIHAALATGVHGVGAGTVAKVGDIAVDSNLSAAAQDAIAKRHTQNTDKTLADADADTKVQVEKSADEDKVRIDVKGVEGFLLNDAGVLTLAKQSAGRAYINANQTIPNATWTKINLNTKVFDIQTEFDVTTNRRFVAKTAGIYLVAGIVTMYQLADGTGVFDAIFKNTDEVAEGRVWCSSAGGSASAMILAILQLAVNDYLELWVYHTYGSNRDAFGEERYTSLSVGKVA
jgi:hypothetical protein